MLQLRTPEAGGAGPEENMFQVSEAEPHPLLLVIPQTISVHLTVKRGSLGPRFPGRPSFPGATLSSVAAQFGQRS